MVAAGRMAVTAIAQSEGPRLSRFLRDGRIDSFERLQMRLAFVGLLVGVACTVGALLVGERVLAILYSPEYAKDYSLLAWLFAANSIWNSCERSGLTQVLKDSGAVMVSDTCPNITIFNEVIASRNLKSGAVDSAKLAHYLPSWGLNMHYGTTADCIEAAVTGKWKT